MEKPWEKNFNIIIANKRKCPCKDCDKREMLCHTKCQGYKEFIEERQANKKAYAEFKSKVNGQYVRDWYV